MPKSKNYTISKTVNPIKPKFEDKAETSSYTSWVGYHYQKPKTTWLTTAIFLSGHNSDADDPIPMRFGTLMEKHMPMTTKGQNRNRK